MRSPGAHHASHAKAGRGCNGCSCTPRARPHGNPERMEPCGLCPLHRRHRLRCARLPAGLAPSSTDDVHGAARPLRTQQFVSVFARTAAHAPSAQRVRRGRFQTHGRSAAARLRAAPSSNSGRLRNSLRRVAAAQLPPRTQRRCIAKLTPAALEPATPAVW